MQSIADSTRTSWSKEIEGWLEQSELIYYCQVTLHTLKLSVLIILWALQIVRFLIMNQQICEDCS